MILVRQYLRAIWSGRKLLVYTFLLCFGLLIYLPFLMIALKSIGRGWFGRLWLPPELTLDWYRFAVEVTNIPEIAKNTLIIAVLAVGMATLIGIPTGWGFGRRKIPGKELLTRIKPRPNQVALTGMIVHTFAKERVLSGENSLVYVDKGLENGVQVGNTFVVIRQGDMHTGVDDEEDRKYLPVELVGKLLVIEVGKGICTCLVTYSLLELYLGEVVEMRMTE